MPDLGEVLSAVTTYGNAREAEGRAESVAELDARANVILVQSDTIAALTGERDQARLDLAAVQVSLMVARDALATAQSMLGVQGSELSGAREEIARLGVRITELEALLAGNPDPVTLIGSNLANPIPANADLQVTRVYFDPGSFTGTAQPTFNNKASCRDAYALGCRVFVVSVKDYTTAAQTKIGAFLDTFPTDAEILFSFFHEHEGNIDDGDFTHAQYVERFDQACAPARARGIKTGPIHNGMSFVGGKWVWGNYREPDLSKCQFWGTDCYDKNSKGVGIYAEWLTYAKATGLPIVIGEHGQPQGPSQAQYAADARSLFISEGVYAACWWHQQFTGNPNYVMSAATQSAWFGLV